MSKLCTGNSARSQMAEAFLRRYGGSDYEVYSGLEPKEISPCVAASSVKNRVEP